MVGLHKRIHDPIVQEHTRSDAIPLHHLVDVEDAEPPAGVGVEPDEDLELLLAGGLALEAHELRDLVGRAVAAGAVEAVGEGVVGGEGVGVALLLAGPAEEAGGHGGIGLGLEDLGDQVRRHAAELAELGEDRRAPTAVTAEGVGDEAGHRGEAAGCCEEGVGRGEGGGRRLGGTVGVPVFGVVGEGEGVGARWPGAAGGLGAGSAVGEEATADDGDVAERVPAVAVEDVGLAGGGGSGRRPVRHSPAAEVEG